MAEESVREEKKLTLQAPKIEVRELNAWFGDNHVLQNINLDFKARTVTAIIGPSGCGKSTFLRCLNRMNDIYPDFRMAGEVILDGENIYDDGSDVVSVRKRIGMVFQKPNPFPKTIRENILFGPLIHGIRNKDKLDEILEKSLKAAALWDEVNDRLDDYAFDLSGGQQQRLCIARALAIEPEVILMDEPCSALDPTATAKIEDLIYELSKKYTVIIVTHNMQQAARVSRWTAFLLTGEIIEYNATETLFETPERKETEDYITGRFG
ncbi:MAG: phosphate ABC transporter ATP-binding protein PstB [Candidatus Wukongarchaeota archaeon]|nr:phosphate ABC transporter ATP-binding protein PstB [Candidatus Wukongarchaeota archaeon]MDO8128887.1 phosphate ABC transporter ATP-binding protein PstB [Candidatus Wukongarchaeota archaeon]